MASARSGARRLNDYLTRKSVPDSRIFQSGRVDLPLLGMEGMFRPSEDLLFNQQPDHSKNRNRHLDMHAALQSDARKLSDEADKLRQAEIDRIYELLLEEPDRWDGLS